MSVLVVTGSTRAASTNTAFCRAAATAVDVTAYTALASLPHFDPDLDQEPLPATVADLRAAVAAADGVVFCTPEYAGTLPGSFMNLLDWLVGSTVLTDKPVAWVKVAADARRGDGAHATLAVVLGYVQARVIEQACVYVPIAREQVDADGTVADRDLVARIHDAARRVLGVGSTSTFETTTGDERSREAHRGQS